MSIREKLIASLADGQTRSGEELARELGCSRTAVWKYVHELEKLGLEIDAQSGSGYRLTRSIELLNEQLIRAALPPDVLSEISSIDVFSSIESTSGYLRAEVGPAASGLRVALAEHQSAGRGRRGRAWLSPFGSGIYLSVARRFDAVPDGLPSLSLALGVGLCRALEPLAPGVIGLKWPNDLVAEDAKLGGLLVDVHGEADGPLVVIVGLGINIDISDTVTAQVMSAGGLAPVGLRSVAGRDVSRNELAAQLVGAIHFVLGEFESRGLQAFASDWARYDRIAERAVVVEQGSRRIFGTARGIDDEGFLLVENGDKTERLAAGEVSLRMQ